MLVHYEKSVVTGILKEEGGNTRTFREEILHRRSQNPILMAMRRNSGIARCQRVEVSTAPAWNQWIDEPEFRQKADIPRTGGPAEYDYDGL